MGHLSKQTIRFRIVHQTFVVLIGALLIGLCSGCDSSSGDDNEKVYPTLPEYFDSKFTIGAAVQVSHLEDEKPLLDTQFNRLTCENNMKHSEICTEEGKYDFTRSDVVADYARNRGIKLTGHTFIWHMNSATPEWLADKTEEEIKVILKDFIDTMIARYHDVTDNWDVVNEVFDGDQYRGTGDTFVEFNWHEKFGDEEYIKLAFKYAQEAVEANGADDLLFYNDYNAISSDKVSKILEMVEWLRSDDELGPVQIDGIGIEGHWNMDWPPISMIEDAIIAYRDAGLKVKISEFDLSIYNDYSSNELHIQPETEFTAEIENRQAKRYKEFFDLFEKYSDVIESVTFWGVTDETSWLNSFPAENRKNYPLFFDRNSEPKQAYYEIVQ